MTNSIRTLTICVAAALCSLAALSASPASAYVNPYPEPSYTKTAGNNSYWFNWQAIKGVSGSQDTYWYYICANVYRNGAQIEAHQGSQGPSAANCSNLLASSPWSTPPSGNYSWRPGSPSTVLDNGQQYSICNQGFHYYGGIWAIDNTSNPDNCARTVIDRDAPQIQVGVNGDQTVTNNPQLALHIAYQDATSPPWFGANNRASNWTCISIGGPCQPAGAPDPDCSVPQNRNSRNTAFFCQADVSAHPDGEYYFCAYSADAAMPDNPNGPNQLGGTSNQANLSGVACGHVALDRQAPVVDAGASHTSAPVGTLINFSGSATDPAGVQPGYDWDFGDNTPHGSGANAAHTYTQAGTYQAKLTVRDNAGNVGVKTVTITITPAGNNNTGNNSNNGNNSNGNNSNGSVGPGTQTGTTGVTPTENQVTPETIVQQNGSTGSQSASVGRLDVIAPKTFRAGKRKLLLALTPETAGKLQVNLLRKSKIVARKGATFGGGGTYALKLGVPAKLKPGSYRLNISFTPKGESKSQNKTLKLRVVKGKKSRGKVVPVTAEDGSGPEGVKAIRNQPRPKG